VYGPAALVADCKWNGPGQVSFSMLPLTCIASVGNTLTMAGALVTDPPPLPTTTV
jgi:hypothetical protein